jgi:hypothetical protein
MDCEALEADDWAPSNGVNVNMFLEAVDPGEL